MNTDDSTNLAWDNRLNDNFYYTVSIKGLKDLSILGGLDDGCDVEQLRSYWQAANTILDIGAGYGRAIDYLLKKGFQGHITAIERCQIFVKHLLNSYGNRIDIIQGDLKQIKLGDRKYDLILWLWSGICDFPAEDHLDIIKKLYAQLTQNGLLVIDTIIDNLSPLATIEHVVKKNVYIINQNESKITTWCSSSVKIKKYAELISCNNFECKPYRTKNGRQRLLHLFH